MLTKQDLEAIRQIVREELAEHLHPTKFRTGQIRGDTIGKVSFAQEIDPFYPCKDCGKAPCVCPKE